MSDDAVNPMVTKGAMSPASASEEVAKKQVWLTRGTYVTLGSLAAFFLASISAVHVLDRVTLIDPLDAELTKAKQQIADGDKTQREIARNLEETTATLKLAVAAREAPLLREPLNGAEVVASEIPLRWEYRNQDPLQSYVVELHAVGAPEEVSIVRQVVRPEEEVYYVPTSLLKGRSKVFWRVTPGRLVDGDTLATSAPSSFAVFTWDSSTVGRIKRTGRIIVGINPQLTGPFERINDNKGALEGADIELMRWLADKLGPELKMGNRPVQVEYRQLPWSILLDSLVRHDVDVVISSMTKTADRESHYRGVKFTEGYYTAHQILIAEVASKLKFPDSFRAGITIGTIAGTTNQQAARLLASKYGFKIRDDFSTFDDLYSALDARLIDAALVDDAFVYDKLAAKRFRQIGETLDKELRQANFYESIIGHGTTAEVYAIAVNDIGVGEGDEVGLRQILNELLLSDEGKAVVANLNARIVAGKE